MDFNHTEDRRMMSDTLSRFILEKYTIENRNDAGASDTGYSPELWNEFAELGIVGALFKEEDGGYGGDAFDISVVFEAIGRGLVLEPFLESAILAGGSISQCGNDEQKTLIKEIIAGSKLAGFAHFEPDGRYDINNVSTTAKKDNDGWVLNGTKSVVKYAENADFIVISARTSGNQDDACGISLFIVPSNADGLSLNGYNIVDGGRAAELTLSNLRLNGGALLGVVDDAFDVLEKVIGKGVLALCAEALGAMDVAKDMTVEYLQTRKQFGLPIGKFQALQHRMAELLIEVEQVRSAVINAAAAVNSTDRVKRERALSAAKYTVGSVGHMVAEETIQLHGGMGMAWELPLGHFAKRLVLIDHELGDEDHHLGRYIELANA